MMLSIPLTELRADNLQELIQQLNTLLYILVDKTSDSVNNISTDNISLELLAKLKAVGVDITLPPTKIQDTFVKSIVKSEEFKNAVKDIISSQQGG